MRAARGREVRAIGAVLEPSYVTLPFAEIPVIYCIDRAVVDVLSPPAQHVCECCPATQLQARVTLRA
jgi:hypothetical protein